jgi:hypothetical protein
MFGVVSAALVWFLYWRSGFSLASDRYPWWPFAVGSVILPGIALFYAWKQKRWHGRWFMGGVLSVELIWSIYFASGVASSPSWFFRWVALFLGVWTVLLLGVLVYVQALSVAQPKVKEAQEQKVSPAILRYVEASRYASWPLSGVAFLLSFILSWDKIWGASAADTKEWWMLTLLIVGVLLSYVVFWLSRPEEEEHSTGDLHGDEKGRLVAVARRLRGRVVGNHWSLAVVLIAFVVGMALYGFWQGWWSHYEAMNLFFVGVLVVVTVLYAGATKRMADEMQTQRYTSLWPILVPKGIPERTEVLGNVLKEPLCREWLSVENVGPGPATRVRVRVEGEKEEYFVGVVAAGRVEPVRGAKPGKWETTGKLQLTIIYEDVHEWEHERTVCLMKESGGWEVKEVRQRPKPQ